MTAELQNALLIHNPKAGNGGSARRRLLDQARHIFAARGIDADLAETTGPGHATEIAARAAAENRGLVIACGGDGTLNEIVNGLAAHQNGQRVPLALLPGGTANILAKELDLPWDIPKAAEKLVDGAIVYSINLGLKSRVGILAYWWAGFREIFRYKFRHFRVISGGRKSNASLVIVGRTQNYGGPFKITTEADLFQDRFEILTLSTQSGLRYLSYLPSLWLNKLRGTQGVEFFKSESLLCEPLAANPVYAQIDGEPLARLPVEFRIVPRALKLLVPRNPQ